jgi:riboflavin synthase
MFTGIITDLGRIRAVSAGGADADTRFEIATGYDTATIDIGASIACSGPCLTVVETGEGWFAVEASAETLRRTSLGNWREGTRVNLERSLRMGDELGGHIVTGHIDCVAEIAATSPEGASVRYDIRTPAAYLPYIAPKGSVALEGVSLTVNELDGDCFSINVIRHTQDCTTFGDIGAGDPLNLEVDVLARYVARQLGKE